MLCSKHPVVNTGRGKNCNVFTAEPARPQRPSKLDNHISSDQHQNAISMEKIQRASLFDCMHQDHITNKVNTIAEREHFIYWVIKEKIAKIASLVDRIGHNERLCDLRHISSTAITEFILLISEHLSNHIVSAVKKSPCWATMVDETTNIATFQQYITFVQYTNTKRCQATAFLDIRHIDACGATAANLFRLWNEVACDYDLDVSKHVAFACDGAAAIIRPLQFSLSRN